MKTIDERVRLIHAKVEMQERIRMAAYNAVEDFRRETGLAPSSIQIHVIDVHVDLGAPEGGSSRHVEIEVESTVEIG